MKNIHGYSIIRILHDFDKRVFRALFMASLALKSYIICTVLVNVINNCLRVWSIFDIPTLYICFNFH